jgi:DNA-binding response OmpR family regulator
MKIMLVDDEQKFAMMLAKRLELRGIQIEVFFSGENALDAVRQGNHFDIAILDVKMPGIGGIELKQKLGELCPEMKFIFLTGHGSSIDDTAGTDEPAFFLPKPLKIDELINILGNLADETATDTDLPDDSGR